MIQIVDVTVGLYGGHFMQIYKQKKCTLNIDFNVKTNTWAWAQS